MDIKIVLEENAIMPSYANEGDAGMDIFCIEDTIIKAHSYSNKVRTGVRVGLPDNTELQIRPKSGVSLNTTLRVVLGTVDSGYTGEVGIIVDNIGDEDIIIKRGKAIAQGVINVLPSVKLSLVDSLAETERGDGGFGSTGRGL